MGGSCSRPRAIWNQQADGQQDGEGQGQNNSNSHDASPSSTGRRAVRHSVDSEVPDGSIANLYPLQDNYVIAGGNRRSPKNLVDLCVDAVCRSLPDLDGELPPGLPQDLVDKIVKSLVNHAALNATTLRVLRHCEIGELSLAGCRGVGDEWLSPLNKGCSSTSYTPCPLEDPESHEFNASTDSFADPMDLDASHSGEQYTASMVQEHTKGSVTIVGPHSPNNNGMVLPFNERSNFKENNSDSSSSCSTSSFVSASSTPYVPGANARAGASPTKVSSFGMDPNTSSQAYLRLDEIMAHSAGAGAAAQIPADHYGSPHEGEWPSITTQLKILDLRGSQRLTDRGLLQLGELGSLEVAKLDNCHSLVGRGMIVFASSIRLHTLSLANCRRLTDEAIVNISHLSSLRALILDGCRCLTDRSLAAISDLYQLQKLDLTQCDLITDEGLDHLHDLPYIQELSLGWCRSISDHGLELLSSQPSRADHLRVLRTARCPITDRGIGALMKLKSLEELNLNGCSSISSAALGTALEKLVNLTSLDVSYCPNIIRVSWQGKINALKTLELCYSGVRDVHLSRLSSLPKLEELNLDSCPVGDWAISHLADNNVVPNLTSLDLADTDLTDLGMVHLPKFVKMTRLSLFYCNITNAGLRHLSSMPSLEVLNLDSREIGDDGLSHLRGLKNLRSLDIFSGRITDAGCVHLSKIKSLESLELCGGGVGDLGCAHLACLDNLTSLNLSQNERITNRGAASLAALTKLKALNLSNTRVNSSALRFLGGLVKLQSLAVYGCKGIEDSDGLHALQRDLPSLRCLRLNSASDNDGIVDASFDSEDEDMLAEEDAVTSLAHMRRGSDGSFGSSESDGQDEHFGEGLSDAEGADSSDNLGLGGMDVGEIPEDDEESSIESEEV